MTKYRLTFTFKAEEDLENILAYTKRKHGLKQMAKYSGHLKKAHLRLISNPGIGHSRSDINSNYLALNVERHVVIYEFDEKSKMIFIIRILHSRMNFKNKF